jgi:hypothetical protein
MFLKELLATRGATSTSPGRRTRSVRTPERAERRHRPTLPSAHGRPMAPVAAHKRMAP